MQKYVIERELPGAGTLSADELTALSTKSNEVLRTMAPRGSGCRATSRTTSCSACTSPMTSSRSSSTPAEAASQPTRSTRSVP